MTVTQAFDNARSLRTAQEHSAAYLNETEVASILPQQDTVASIEDKSRDDVVLSSASHSISCYFCGRSFHQRNYCPAKEITCYSCGKKGHYSKVCRSKSQVPRETKSRQRQTASISVGESTTNLCSVATSCPTSLSPASLQVSINGRFLTALVDSGSSESYMNSNCLYVCAKLKLDVYLNAARQVQMASTAMKIESTGFCLADLSIGDTAYPSTRLNILENLCCDIILGLDFQSQHQSLIIEFNGESPDLVVAPDSHCLLTAVVSPEVSLFSKLSDGVRPIATRSRRYNLHDKAFIQENIDKLLEEDIIRPSNSPWRAPVVIVKDEFNRHKKRMCVDYSQTINIYTELDAYPLPRIDDMVNELAKYTAFLTFDLRSAYHQVKIVESDCIFTAFEANGRLYEFTRILCGVKNGVVAFQRVISEFIERENLKDVFPYLNDVTVAGRTQEDHDANVKLFLDTIHRNNFNLNETKTISSVNSVQILGYVVENGLIIPDPERLRPLKDFPFPVNSKQLKSVLGMFAYYAEWIDRFTDKVRPLANAKVFPTSKDIKALQAFQLLKQY